MKTLKIFKRKYKQLHKTVKRNNFFFSKQNKFKKRQTNQENTKARINEDSGGVKITRLKKRKSNLAKSKNNPKTILTKNNEENCEKNFKVEKGEVSDKPEFSERHLTISQS